MSDNHRPSCDWAGCHSSAEARLQRRPLCVVHFYEVAARRISALQSELDVSGDDRVFPADAQLFLSNLVGETTVLSAAAKHLNPGLREGLLQLSTSAAQLYKRIHRAPRIPKQIEVLLTEDFPSKRSPERASTINISRTGACLETSLPLEIDQTIWLERPDTKQKVRARVAWTRSLSSARMIAGLALITSDDFWTLRSKAAK